MSNEIRINWLEKELSKMNSHERSAESYEANESYIENLEIELAELKA